MRTTGERLLRPATALIFGMALAAFLQSGAARPDDFGCCRLHSNGQAEADCHTFLSVADCADLAKKAGKCFVYQEHYTCFNGVCVKAEGQKSLSSLDAVASWISPAKDDQTCVTDLVRPSCQRISGSPPGRLDVRIQDTGLGLQSVVVATSENAAVSIPSFTVGTKDPITVTAFRVDPNSGARVEFQVMDAAGNQTACDPILTQIRGLGAPASETYTGLRAAEDTVTIENGSPGLRSLEVIVNGARFQVSRLRDGELRNLDISPALLPGRRNVVRLKSHGSLGASASVTIWDGKKAPPGR